MAKLGRPGQYDGSGNRVMSASARRAMIKYVRPRHTEIARMLVIGCLSQGDIAKRLDISESWLSILISQPLMQIQIKKLQEMRDRDALDLVNQMDKASMAAFELVERTMYQTKSERMGVHCAESILDRAGYGKVTKSISTNMNANIDATMTREELVQLLSQRLGRIKDEADGNLRDIADAHTIKAATVPQFEQPIEPVEQEHEITYGNPD